MTILFFYSFDGFVNLLPSLFYALPYNAYLYIEILFIQLKNNFIIMSKASDLGRLGEELAATYLMRNGFRILQRNWNRYNGYELDIVAYKGGVLHFVEVKTRSSEILSSPFDAIDNDKMVHIYSAIQHYFRYFRLSDSYPWVFDAVGVVYENENKYSIDFREDVGGNVDYAAYYRKKYRKPPLTW